MGGGGGGGGGAYYKAVHTKEVWEPGGTYKGSLGTRECILRKSGNILRKSANQGVHTNHKRKSGNQMEVWCTPLHSSGLLRCPSTL